MTDEHPVRVGRWLLIGMIVFMVAMAGLAWLEATTTDHRFEGAEDFQNECREDGGIPQFEQPDDTLRLYCEYDNGTRRNLNDD